MRIYKCDLCGKNINKERQEFVKAGIGWNDKELCKDCGKPVVKFLIQKKLFTKEEINKIFQ